MTETGPTSQAMWDTITRLNPNNPPSKHALEFLARLPMPRQEMNFTVAGKLLQFGLARSVMRPSPYKTHKPGHMIEYLERI